MKIFPVKSYSNSFGTAKNSANQNQNSNNPISKKGEKALLVKATFFGGLAIGARLLFELLDEDIVFNKLSNSAEKIINKQHKNISANKKALYIVGAFAGLVAAFVSGFALLYTLFNAPKINYNGNINAFKKGKDMDVYIKGNNVEKELYTQMNEKAKIANSEEKAKLQQQYAQMQMAKNRVPDFIKDINKKDNKNLR